MLNRETTNNCRRSRIIIGSHQNHNHHHLHHNHQQQTELCLPSSSRTSGSQQGNKSISSFIINNNNNNNIDAILFEEGRNSQLVSRAQNSSSLPLSQASLPTTQRTLIKTTVPKYTSSPNKFSQNNTITRSRQLSKFSNPPNNIIKQEQRQPVNSRAIIDKNNCFSKKGGSPRKVNTYKLTNMIKMNFIYSLEALLVALCAISMAAQFATADGSLHSNLQKLKISPDIINVPSNVELIKVELHGNTVKPGDPVPAKNFKDLNMAKIVWDVSNYDARHTLLLLDLDRKNPGNGTNSIYNQFTSLNIPGNVINAGQTIVAFDTPIVPCQPSSKHRLLMLALHQKQNIDISDVAYMSASSGQSSKRENFKLQDFITRHRLDIVAANVFLAIGETNGVCSSSSTLHSLQSISSSILIAMVTAIIALRFNTSCRRSIVN